MGTAAEEWRRKVSPMTCALDEICYAKERVGTLAATETNVGAEDNFSGEKEGKTAAKSLMEIREVQIAASLRDFAGIVEEQKTDGANDSAVIFRLDEK